MLHFIVSGSSSFVGFTAYATTTRSYNQGDLVIFDGVVSNYGGHYQADESVFVCPYTGIYVFHVSVLTEPGTLSMHIDLVKDNTYIISALADNQTDEISSGSNTVVLQCDEGQRVWMEVTY